MIFPPFIASFANGELVPMPTFPLERIVNFEVVVVANVAGEAVSKYRFPPAFLIVQISEVSDPSLSASCGRVDDDTWRAHAGVDVPIPSPTVFPPFGVTLRNEDVDVANLEFGACTDIK